ncbi:hypothetical protein DL771_006377 [Monosporascus sp. 5C6A]|nr:hypothetical protein DL771_006377 [Monosporascus sp. 5C6A]
MHRLKQACVPWKVSANRPTAEEHAATRNQLKNVNFIKPRYADETEIDIAVVCRKWKRYCKEQKFGERQAALKPVTRETMMSFFLRVYIRQFQQLYTCVAGRYIDRKDAKEPYEVCGGPVLGADNLLAILTFNIAYGDGIFLSERQRVQLAGCYQFLCYTGVRPAEIVHAERKKPKDGCADEIKGVKSTSSKDSNDFEFDCTRLRPLVV